MYSIGRGSQIAPNNGLGKIETHEVTVRMRKMAEEVENFREKLEGAAIQDMRCRFGNAA